MLAVKVVAPTKCYYVVSWQFSIRSCNCWGRWIDWNLKVIVIWKFVRCYWCFYFCEKNISHLSIHISQVQAWCYKRRHGFNTTRSSRFLQKPGKVTNFLDNAVIFSIMNILQHSFRLMDTTHNFYEEMKTSKVKWMGYNVSTYQKGSYQKDKVAIYLWFDLLSHRLFLKLLHVYRMCVTFDWSKLHVRCILISLWHSCLTDRSVVNAHANYLVSRAFEIFQVA